MRQYAKQYSKRSKLAALSASLTAGICAYLAALYYFNSDLTQWQKDQPADLFEKTGLTKTKNQFDALSLGGLAFCITAASIVIVARIKTLKKEKRK